MTGQGKITRIKVQTYALSGGWNGTLVDYCAYMTGNTGVDSLRLLGFIMKFINLLKKIFLNFIYDILHWIVGLSIKGRGKQFKIPLIFKRKLFCYQKLEKAFRKKPPNCFFFNLYVCLLACCCFSCFLTKKAMAINQFHY